MNHYRKFSLWNFLSAKEKHSMFEFAVTVAGALVILAMWIHAVNQ